MSEFVNFFGSKKGQEVIFHILEKKQENLEDEKNAQTKHEKCGRKSPPIRMTLKLATSACTYGAVRFRNNSS